MGKIINAISCDGSLSCHIIDSTDIVSQAEQFHQTSATATAALGRLLTAVSIIGSKMKFEEERIILSIKGDGPIKSIIAVGDYKGNVKGYPGNNVVEIPLSAKGKLDVSGAIGANGHLVVTRDFGSGEPYTGTIDLVSGEIAEDITAYYAQSEQVPTACALGVLVNPNLTVKKAGGFLLQVLPNALEDTISQVEKNINNIKPMTTMMDSGKSINDILGIVFENIEYEILEEHDAAYICDCSREKVEKALISLGAGDIQALLDENKEETVVCPYCNKKYKFQPVEIAKLLEKSKS